MWRAWLKIKSTERDTQGHREGRRGKCRVTDRLTPRQLLPKQWIIAK